MVAGQADSNVGATAHHVRAEHNVLALSAMHHNHSTRADLVQSVQAMMPSVAKCLLETVILATTSRKKRNLPR